MKDLTQRLIISIIALSSLASADKFLERDTRRELQFFDLSQIQIITIPEPVVLPDPVDTEITEDDDVFNFIGDEDNWGEAILEQIKNTTEKYNITFTPPPVVPKQLDQFLDKFNEDQLEFLLVKQLKSEFSGNPDAEVVLKAQLAENFNCQPQECADQFGVCTTF